MLLEVFSEVTERMAISDGVSQDVEAFVCPMYGWPKTTNINDVRYEMFQQN